MVRRIIWRCTKTREAILEYIQVNFKEGGDTSRTIELGVRVDKELPAVPIDTTNIGEMYYWRYKMNGFVELEDLLTNNLTATYRVFWGQCTNQLKMKLEARQEFDGIKVSVDVVKLSKLIRAVTGQAQQGVKKELCARCILT